MLIEVVTPSTNFYLLKQSKMQYWTSSKVQTISKNIGKGGMYIYIYGKILSTFNNFFIDFSRIVYWCYLRAVRSTQTKLALKAAIGITKMPPGIGMSLHRMAQREGV